MALLAGAGGWWLHLEASTAVDTLFSRPIWKENGHITGTANVVPGMAIGPNVLAETLQAAGYSRVSGVAQSGDFTIEEDAILIRLSSGDALVTFRNDEVASVSPDGRIQVVGVELAGVGRMPGEIRRPVRRSEVPEHLVQAILAMEDARFFSHPGVDALGIGRALIANLFHDGGMQGGSTLTQQLAKNLFLSAERTLERKLKELALAVVLEDRLSKEEILELYLNQVYLGQILGVGIGGVDQAAQSYFGTSARRLSLGQSATLAGMISAPNRYSPSRHPLVARERRDMTLDRMVKLGWIDAGVAEKTKRETLVVVASRGRKQAPWGVDFAVDRVESEVGEGAVAGGAIHIQTTIDPLLQWVAEESTRIGVQALGAENQDAQVALVALDASNGDILAMVGGKDYQASQYNRAVHGHRQIGSTVKPLSWMFAYDTDPLLSPSTLVPDEPMEIVFDGTVWSPRNYDGKFVGELSLHAALQDSRNIPAVHVAEVVGFETLATRLRTVGLSTARALPATSLGAFDASPMTLAAAYTVFPGRGRVVEPRIVRAVRMPDGTEGWGLAVQKWRATSSRSAFLASMDLRGVIQGGTGRAVRKDIPTEWVAGKTGTTDGARDAWFVGFSGDLVVAVWVGHDKGRVLGRTGAQAALPIWADFMAGSGRLATDAPVEPDGVVGALVCPETSMIPASECPPAVTAWFSEGAEPTKVCAEHDSAGDGTVQEIIESIRTRLNGPGPPEPVVKKKKGWLGRWRKD